MARMKPMQCLLHDPCDFNASGFWGLQTWFNGARYPCQLCSRTRTFFAVEDGDKFPMRRRRAVPGQLANHIRGQGKVRHGSTGECVARSGYARIADAWVVVILCTWEGDSLVGGYRFGSHQRGFGCRTDRARRSITARWRAVIS